MKLLLTLLLLIPSLSWGLTFKDGKQVSSEEEVSVTKESENVTISQGGYQITNPGLIFITQDQLKLNIQKSGNVNDACKNEKYSILESIDLKVMKKVKGAEIGDIIRMRLNPLLKKYCNFLISEINQDNEKLLSIKKELLDFYIRLAKSDFLLGWHKDGKDTDHAYATSISIAPTIFIYAQMKKYFSKDEQNLIEKMFLDLVKKNEYNLQPSLVGEHSSYANHGFYTNNIRLLISIVVGDNKMYNSSITYFLKQMKLNKTNSGLFKFDSKRGECALHYNLHGLSPIMSTLWNLNLQGLNFLDTKINGSHTIDEIISVIIDATEDPSIVINENKKLGYLQSGRKTCSSGTEVIKVGKDEIRRPYESTLWFAPYFALSGNEKNREKFQNSYLSKKYYYSGQPDTAFVSYFYPFIYLDPKSNEPINFDTF